MRPPLLFFALMLVGACSTPDAPKTAEAGKEAAGPLSQRDCVVQIGSSVPRCSKAGEAKTISGEELRRSQPGAMPSAIRNTP